MGMSDAPPPIVDTLRRVRRRRRHTSAPRLLVFLPSALTRVPIVAALPHQIEGFQGLSMSWRFTGCIFRGPAALDAPERVYDQRRCTGSYHRTPCRGSPGSPYQIRSSLKALQNPSSLTSTRPRSVLFSRSWRVVAGLTLVLPEERPNTRRQRGP